MAQINRNLRKKKIVISPSLLYFHCSDKISKVEKNVLFVFVIENLFSWLFFVLVFF